MPAAEFTSLVRTDWLNTSVDDLRSGFSDRPDRELIAQLPTLRATAEEAERRGHRSRHQYLISLVRRAERCMRRAS